MGTKIKVVKNPRNCIELGTLIGYPVKEWTLEPNGAMEVDIDADLTPTQVLQVTQNLELVGVHLNSDGNDPLVAARERWAIIKALPDGTDKFKQACVLLARMSGLEI